MERKVDGYRRPPPKMPIGQCDRPHPARPDGAQGWRLTRAAAQNAPRPVRSPPSGSSGWSARLAANASRPAATAQPKRPHPARDLLIYGSAKCGTAKPPQRNGAAFGWSPMRWSPAVPELTHTPCARCGWGTISSRAAPPKPPIHSTWLACLRPPRALPPPSRSVTSDCRPYTRSTTPSAPSPGPAARTAAPRRCP
jgi:hypothetical protein